MVHGLEGKFGVVSDPSGAQEVCVPAVAAVKQTEFVVVGSHPAQRKFTRQGLVETPAGVLCKLTHTCTSYSTCNLGWGTLN